MHRSGLPSLRNAFLFLALSLAGCGGSEPEAGKASASADYLAWFVEHQSGDAELASRLRKDFERGYELFSGTGDMTAAERVEALEAAGLNAILVGPGMQDFEVPGQTVSFLVMDRENGCKEITYERWTSANASGPANIGLVGIGMEDVTGESRVEKTLHIAAIELPEAGDFAEIRSNSFSPLGKGIIAFAIALGTTGCPAPAGPTAPTTAFPLPVPGTYREVGLDGPELREKKKAPDGSLVKVEPTDPMPDGFDGVIKLTWTSFLLELTSTLSTRTGAPLAGNTVEVWLANESLHPDRMSISAISGQAGSGKVFNGDQARAATNNEGNVFIEVTIDSDATHGGAAVLEIWGRDTVTGITKKVLVEIDIP